MELKNSNITVKINMQSGATQRIQYSKDQTEMNWVMENLSWGLIPDFSTAKVEESDGKIRVITENNSLSLRTIIQKNINENDYFESYKIENTGETEFFLTKDNFGIPFPYQCHYGDGGDLMSKSVNHIWCADDICWIYSCRTNGEKPYLVMNVTEGSIEDYSIDYDISLVQKGVDYRGCFILHPKSCIIPPKGHINLCFRYRFTEQTPETADLDFKGAMRFTAEKYSFKPDEDIKLTLEYCGEWDNAKIYCGNNELPYIKNGNKAEIKCHFSELGEKKITAFIDGRTTFIRLNIISDVKEILEKRAYFIARKQQYHSKGSHLDGAYLIYDSETDGLYYGKTDHNAGRERIVMGIIVCKQLQNKYSQELMDSLKLHREFVERELFDIDSAEVFNDICKNNKFPRIYNFPWFSVYYLEWYKLTGEKQCLINSARILLKYYELDGRLQDSQCIEAVEIVKMLEKEGMNELRESVIKEFLSHTDSIIERKGKLISKEVTYASEAPNTDCAYFSQAYILTGNKAYLKEAEKYLKMSYAFYGCQPDYHLNCVNVRYWDNYWFGKIRSYGDVFPHYWSTLTGWALGWYDRALSGNYNQRDINSNLSGNLCIYGHDGFASNCYLYPYRIRLYSSDKDYENQFMKPNTAYGKRYDPWSNDQDWSLYYASIFFKD